MARSGGYLRIAALLLQNLIVFEFLNFLNHNSSKQCALVWPIKTVNVDFLACERGWNPKAISWHHKIPRSPDLADREPNRANHFIRTFWLSSPLRNQEDMDFAFKIAVSIGHLVMENSDRDFFQITFANEKPGFLPCFPDRLTADRYASWNTSAISIPKACADFMLRGLIGSGWLKAQQNSLILSYRKDKRRLI